MTVLDLLPGFRGLRAAADVEHYRAEYLGPLPYSDTLQPPARDGSSRNVSVDQAATLPSVYRALDVINTSAEQLPYHIERSGRRLSLNDLPSTHILRRPNVELTAEEFTAGIVLSLAARGNAYLHKKFDAAGRLVNVDVLNPAGVHIGQDNGRRVYWSAGKKLPAADVVHITRLRLPGAVYGLGPIQAAQVGLRLGLDQQEFAGGWFDTTGEPAGVLKSDQALNADDARRARRMWNLQDPETGEPLPYEANPTRTRVLGKGLDYDSLLISPKDALWLDAQQFSVLEVARLFGIPSSLMYVNADGASNTYQNVQQELQAFVTYTLMGYLRPIENALTRLAPAGQRVRFNVDALLRPDTTTRYAAHESGIRAGWLHPDEARDLEGMAPMTDEQRATMPKTTPAPPAEEAPAA